MRKITQSFNYITLVIICQALAICALLVTPVFADTSNFEFQDFTADYYLSKDQDGISHLRVSESLTAIFPNHDQNRGIFRIIPFTNQGGKNLTILKHWNPQIEVLRNGHPEPINKIDHSDDHFTVYIGDADTYVHGTQKYTINYAFERVITDWGSYQELYWDTNGTGWPQKFGSVTARIHFENPEIATAYTNESWCYVGYHGSRNQSRCTISKISDGIAFTATHLNPYENLTFVLKFKPTSFTIPDPPKNYTNIILLTIQVIICIIASQIITKIQNKLIDQQNANEALVVPQYTPLRGVSVAELTATGKIWADSSRVATLIDLAVNHKVELIKNPDEAWHKSWSVRIKNLSNVSPEAIIVLKVLNGGNPIRVGDTILVKTQKASLALDKLNRSFDTTVTESLRQKNLFTPKGFKRKILTPINLLSSLYTFSFLITIFFIPMITPKGYDFIGGMQLFSLFVVFGAIFLVIISAKKYSFNFLAGRTVEGIEASKYLEGLKTYIKMAEQERLHFMQSVDGADVSPSGVVRLYERLLPYAIIFRMERTWFKELQKYYELAEIDRPSWYSGTNMLAFHDFSTAITSVSHSINSASPTSSSSSSGSGGGGSSGGGGGGGGGGGW